MARKKNYCDDCFYYRTITSDRFCAYLLITDQRRPCPPGEGCTVKIKRSVKRRKSKEVTGDAG